jgi:hypothetical protein
MPPTTLRTTWEQLPAALAEQTRQIPEAERQAAVDVVVVRSPQANVVIINEAPLSVADRKAERAAWVKRMVEFSESHKALPYRVDDSRQSIIDEVIP